MERRIEDTFVSLLEEGRQGSKKRVVLCGDVQELIFPWDDFQHRRSESQLTGRVDSLDGSSCYSDESGGVILPGYPTMPCSSSASLMQQDADSRTQGMQRARQREVVRQAARRGVAFGFLIKDDGTRGASAPDAEPRRKVMAIKDGKVVDSSFAKGEWGVQWYNQE